MIRTLAVLRPEPGNAATAARIEALGLRVVRLPLFAVRALAWDVPDPAAHDALIVTSANTIRHCGDALASLGLPVLAVGAASAAAARAAGLDVALTGDGDAARLLALAEAAGFARALHLGGRERTMPDSAIVRASIAVYASERLPVCDATALDDTVALLHSARAARRLGDLIADRARIRIAAISGAVLAAAGPRWAATAIARTPDDTALIAAAATLAR